MNPVIYFLLALLMTAGVTYLIRLLPLLFVRKRITNTFVRSFLHYVPYAVLSALAFPAVLYCTDNVIACAAAAVACAAAAVACAVLAYLGQKLLTCMLGSVVTVLLAEGLIWLLG